MVRKVDLCADHLLLIIGTIGSGKTYTAGLMAEKLGYRVVNSGQVVSQLISLPSVSETDREAFQAAAWQLVEASEGRRRLADALVHAGLRIMGEKVIIDGIRQLDVFNAVKNSWPGPVYTIFVHTPPDLAFESYRTRERQISIREFMKLYDADVERGVHDVARHADIIVYNWFGEDSHRRTVDELIGLLGGRKEAAGARRRI